MYKRAVLVAFLASLVIPAVPVAGSEYADAPVGYPGDYNGDGIWDLAIVYPQGNQLTWYVVYHTPHHGGRTVRYIYWGCVSCEDRPVPADYDGDGAVDIAVYRETTGEWFILSSATGELIYQPWGSHHDRDAPVPFDYDGDGKADIAIYRPEGQQWYILRSATRTLWKCGYQVC